MMLLDNMKDRIRGYGRKRNALNCLKRPAVATPHGFKVSGPTEMQDGTFEATETALISELIAASDQFINVGANVGYYCCFAQLLGVKTYAIEPVAINVQLLMRNMVSNGWGDAITILPVAVGEASGVMEIYGEGTGASLLKGWARNPKSLSQQVSVVRLDDVIPAVTHRSFILMDVEGFELFALRGASRILSLKPTLMIEINITDHQPGGAALSDTAAATFALLRDAGYDPYEVASPPRPLNWKDISAACRGEVSPIDTHNFLFVAEGQSVPAQHSPSVGGAQVRQT